MYNLTEEEWECVRVCVANAPIPYDITKKKIPADILAKIGQPTPNHKRGRYTYSKIRFNTIRNTT